MTKDPSTFIDGLLPTPPFSLEAKEKRALFAQRLSDLTLHHYNHSRPYQRICNMLGYVPGVAMQMEDVPYIPVRLFKEFDLISVSQEQVVKTMTSSGTSGNAVSRIYLDKATAANQARVLVKIVSSFVGNKRLPLLIVDSPAVIKNRDLFSARGAGILGFSMLGHDATYMLNEDLQIDVPRLDAFLEKHGSSRLFLFGFTFIIWEHLCQALRKKGRRLDLNGILIHGGGWKKLTSIAVGNDQFKRELSETTGIQDVFNYYGMVEQTGSVFMECPQGHLHSSIYSDLIIRDPHTFSALPFGVPGLVQLVSLLPTSYPGHSILTEDIGEILGEDDCPCGRKGRYFRMHGRVQNAEVRGCSDVLSSN